MADYAMPMLILNMGGEMLYILEQRLVAQRITLDKQYRVLLDVIHTMFSSKFIDELLRPQKMYTNSSTRQIFDRLAHSSIMRLNTSSMDKLYDLMSMGYKYQLVQSSSSTLMKITFQHLHVLRSILEGGKAHYVKNGAGSSSSSGGSATKAQSSSLERTNSSSTSTIVSMIDTTIGMVDATAQRLLTMYAGLTVGDYGVLRQTLLRFFQDRRIKVSLFLAEQIQSTDGSMICSHKPQLYVASDPAQPALLDSEIEVPGSIRYFSADGTQVVRTEYIQLPNALNVTKQQNPQVVRHELGSNLYARDRRKQGQAAVTVDSTSDDANSTANDISISPHNTRSPAQVPTASVQHSTAVKHELNSLASVLAPMRSEPGAGNAFVISSLFSDEDSDDSLPAPPTADEQPCITISAQSRQGKNARMQKLQFDEEKQPDVQHGTAAGGDDDDDLLDLMDKAGI